MKDDQTLPSKAEVFDFATLVTCLTSVHHQSQAHANRSVNQSLVLRNWLFGWYIVEFEQNGADRAAYGSQLVQSLATELKPIGRGFSPRSLALICAFYRSFSRILQTPSAKLEPGREITPIAQTLSAKSTARKPLAHVIQSLSDLPQFDELIASPFTEQFPLSWSHYVTLLTIDNADERSFYEIETSQNNWGVRELKRQINSSLYQRLALSRDKDDARRLAGEGQVIGKAADLIKNPFVLEFLNLDEKAGYSERDLETEIIDKLQAFLLELGKGFLFEARQRRFTFDDDHYYVDLVLYNRLLRCYVLLDLKIGKLDHGDLGQMQMYVNYFDRHVKLDDELPTVGIVLCAHNNQAMVELTLPDDANIFASKYQLYLPSKEELKRELEKIEAEIDEFGLEAGQ